MQVSAPGGQEQPLPCAGGRNRWEKVFFTRESLGFAEGGRGGRDTPPHLGVVRGPRDTGWQRGRGNGSAISFHKLKLVLIS